MKGMGFHIWRPSEDCFFYARSDLSLINIRHLTRLKSSAGTFAASGLRLEH